MGGWPGKFIIGLTGNIATGKSVVRRMLEHLGAYGIDADALARRAIAKGAPGYEPVIETFGRWILDEDGQIDRARLGRLVFAEPEALRRLEAIVHPLVLSAIDLLVRRAPQRVIVIEAIKLLESGLAERCDSIWVTHAPSEVQIARLLEKRHMDRASAMQRLEAQTSQDEKLRAADVVIRNEGSFEQTWAQVLHHWNRLFPAPETEAAITPAVPRGKMQVQRARPKDAEEIAALITHLSQGQRRLGREEVMAAFGEKAFLILRLDGRGRGVAGWKVENLVARTDDVYLDPELDLVAGLGAILQEVERASRELQCEVSLLFLPGMYAERQALLRTLGYEKRTPGSLGVRDWEEAAAESMTPDTVLFFKQLRRDRVLQPL